MTKRTTLVLAVLAAALLAFIVFYEQDLSSTDQLGEREGRVLVAFDRDAVEVVRITRRGKKLVLHREAAGEDADPFERRWRLEAPIDAPADTDVVESLVGALDYAEPRRRLGGLSQEDTDRFGLASPRVTVEVEGAGRTSTLRFGGETPQEDGVYARVGADAAQALVVGRELFEAVDHEAAHFRDKRLVRDLEVADAASLRVRGESGEVRLERDEGGWRLEAPVSGRAAGGRVDGALRALADLEAQRFVAERDAVVPERYGLEAPVLVVDVRVPGEDGAETKRAVLRVGDACAQVRGARYARVDDGPAVCVDEVALDPLRRPPEEWRERRLTTAAPEDVARVEIRDARRRLVLERGESAWRWRAYEPADTEEPTAEGPASDVAIADLVKGLERTEVEIFLPAGERGLRGAGLAAPDRTLSIVGLDERVESLALGGASPSGVFARRGDEETIVVVPSDVEARFDASPTRFRAPRVPELDRDAVTRLTVDRSEGPDEVAVRQSAAGDAVVWRLEAPIDAPADRITIADLLQAVAELDAIRWVAESSSPSQGFANPRFTVSLELASAPAEGAAEGDTPGSEGLVIEVGGDAPGGDDDASAGVFARLDGGAVFVAATTLVDRLGTLLADRGALATDRADCEAITLERDGRNVVLDLPRSPTVRDALSSLRAVDVLAYGRTALKPNEIALRIAVRRRAEARPPTRYTLVVGPAGDDGRRRVRREDLPIAYAVLASDLAPFFDAAP